MPSKLDGIRMGSARLNDNFAGQIPSSRSTRNLNQQLKRSLIGPKVRNVQRKIRIHEADKSDVWEIQAFCDHLRSDKDINSPRTKVSKNLAKQMLPAHRISINANYFRVRQNFHHGIFDTLRSHALPTNSGTAARRAHHWGLGFCSTQVALQSFVTPVVSHWDAATIAHFDMPTFLTKHGCGESSPIDKQDTLLFTFKSLLQLVDKHSRKLSGLPIAGYFLPHVHYMHHRERTLIHSLRQPIDGILSVDCISISFQGRCRRTQNTKSL